MKRRMNLVVSVLLAGMLLISGCQSGTDSQDPQSGGTGASADKEFFSVATGTMSGTYYSLGNSLASLYNEKAGDRFTFSAEATNGSGQNVEFLSAGESELAFINNDVAKIAYAGTGQYEGNQQEKLRGITAVYGNSVHIVVPSSSDVESVADLAGKRVSVGAAGSGVESIAKLVVGAYDMEYWDRQDFTPEYLGVSESMEQLKNGQLDAVFMTGLPPMSAVVDVFMSSDMKLIALESDVVDQLTQNYPELYKVTIPGGTYQGQDEDILTVANSGLLLTSSDMADDVVYELTKILFENTQYLIERNNVWAQMTLEDATKGMTVPLHPGAEKYLREAGALE